MHVIFRCDPALADLIPKPVPARQGLPDWLRTMPRHAFSDMHGEDVRTVKHCPPFIDAMAQGFIIPLPCDVTVAAGRLSWDWNLPPLAAGHHPRAPISFHAPAQVEGTPFSQPDQVIVKFNSFWTIELEPGLQCIPSIAPICRSVCSAGLSMRIASMMSAFYFPPSGSMRASRASCRAARLSRSAFPFRDRR
jgi:hypothetical protein